MAENNINEKIDETKNLREKMPEILPLLDEIKGHAGAKIELKVGNVGSGLATEYVDITLKYEDKDGKTREEGYFVKRFLKEKMQPAFPFLQTDIRGSLQQTEFDLLSGYKDAGCNVSTPCVKTRDILIVKKIKGESLENRLLKNGTDEEKRIALIRKASLYLDKINVEGWRMQGDILTNNLEIAKRIMRTADLLRQSEKYFTSFVATGEDLRRVKERGEDGKELIKQIKKECSDNFSIFNSFFEILDRHFSRQGTQLIHGDMTTYHVIFDEDEEPWFIDFGKPKFANVVFDFIPLHFSQDTNLPIKATEEIFREYLDRKYTPKDRIDEEFKSLYLGACFSNIGRGSKNRVLKTAFPNEYSQFVIKHPSYDRSLIFYIDSTREITEHLLSNKDRFKIEKDAYQSIKNFSGLLNRLVSVDGYSLSENRCPISIIDRRYEEKHNWPSSNRPEREIKDHNKAEKEIA